MSVNLRKKNKTSRMCSWNFLLGN